MTARMFVTCLNQERKVYNVPILGIFASLVGFLVVGFVMGLIWGFGGGALGFILGSWFSRQWHAGNLQRKMYWYLPWQKMFAGKNVPESHNRNLM